MINIPNLLSSRLKETNNFSHEPELKCDLADEFGAKLAIYDSILNCLVPFLIALVFSFLTLKKLIQIKNNHNLVSCDQSNKAKKFTTLESIKNRPNTVFGKKHLANSYELKSNAKVKKSISNYYMEPEFMVVRYLSKRRSMPNVVQQFESNFNSPFVRKRAIVSRNNHTMAAIQMKNRKASKLKITFMLMIFPISFLLTTFPIFLIILFKLFLNIYLSLKVDLELAFDIAKVFMFLNNSLNMLFLIFFGKDLRKDFRTLFSVRNIFKKRSGMRSLVSYV
jgi:hypothetical protein